ncbi:MAG TPA: cytochrome c, partial [Gemmatimonadaceae bacterium]
MSSIRLRITTLVAFVFAVVVVVFVLLHDGRVAAAAQRARNSPVHALAPVHASPVHALAPASGATLAADLGCAACHLGAGDANLARAAAPALGNAGDRYSSGYLFASLDASLDGSARARSDTVRARMPDFHLDDRERLALTLYLGTLHDANGSPGPRVTAMPGTSARDLDAELVHVRSANPGITATAGERIFVALDCAGCHAMPAGAPAAWPSGPDLSTEGSRVRPEWLRAYLARPHAVRPFGAHPGTGSRMPDFHLTPDEADSLAAWLGAKRVALPAFAPAPLPVFAEREAESLMRDKLPCLGCHALGGKGGRIGPDLSAVSVRLQPAYIHAMITDPRHTAPGTIMPRTPMPARTLELVATYLATRTPPS